MVVYQKLTFDLIALINLRYRSNCSVKTYSSLKVIYFLSKITNKSKTENETTSVNSNMKSEMDCLLIKFLHNHKNLEMDQIQNLKNIAILLVEFYISLLFLCTNT
ncbi:hypothetical protein T11_8667 [Trichinella zimbabwensis]|uniref:Uncharacterized protein n=1 Tax=Trichinella zimbabwensis TaxID=268475 RepID=A0A0V1HKB7_9BILA|nr:hypothetical protein T11_8667 [Trichinella zimbabwensis]